MISVLNVLSVCLYFSHERGIVIKMEKGWPYECQTTFLCKSCVVVWEAGINELTSATAIADLKIQG